MPRRADRGMLTYPAIRPLASQKVRQVPEMKGSMRLQLLCLACCFGVTCPIEVIPVINLDLDPLAWKIYSVLPYLLHECYVWYCTGLFFKVSTCEYLCDAFGNTCLVLHKVEHVSTCIADL